MNKKYKLIKKYPSLPNDWEVGMIVGLGDRCTPTFFSPCNGKYKDYYIPVGEVIGNEEYWEEEDSDYIILSFRDILNDTIFNLNKEGNYSQTGTGYDISLDSMMSLGRSVESGDIEIYSIKRTIDGKIFTIGDMIEDINKYDFITRFKIKRIKIDQIYKLKFLLESGSYYSLHSCKKSKLIHTSHGEDFYEGDEYFWVSEQPHSGIPPFTISGPHKMVYNPVTFFEPYIHVFKNEEKAEEWINKNTKKPLIKTEDGVDVFEGDKIHWVGIGYQRIEYYYSIPFFKSHVDLDFTNTYKLFSTKKLADEFVMKVNKKSLSVNDVISLLNLEKKEINKLIQNI
jgi:hypothetical protein